MDYKNFMQTLGFIPKENTSGIFYKKYGIIKESIKFFASFLDKKASFFLIFTKKICLF